MNILITVVVFIIIFSILVLVHECGHFFMAKRAGIKVEEFGFGLPPRLWGKKKGETTYSINWIPFGGFVRMLVEDASDPTMLKKKRSFAAQSMRARVSVIVAGVVMNFFLAWLLLSIGFTVGMQPFLGPDNVLDAVDNGVVVLTEGVKVKEVLEDSFEAEAGFLVDDALYSFNGKVIDHDVLAEVMENPVGSYGVIRNGGMYKLNVSSDFEGYEFGDSFYDVSFFPRAKVYSVDKNSVAYKAGIRAGDLLLSVNGKGAFSVEDYEEIIRGESEINYEVLRGGIHKKIVVKHGDLGKIIVSNVLKGSPADVAGILEGDVISYVDGEKATDVLEMIGYVSENYSKDLTFAVIRGGNTLSFKVKPGEDKRIGVLLSELVGDSVGQGMTLFNTNVLSSVLEIQELKYPFYQAAYKGLTETYRLSKLTVGMFGDFIGGLFATGEVPESVAGPIGIAQMTHTFVQEGFIPLLRFVAILSLSLAVLNILPFPALDGGRLLFIVIEFSIGRRIDQRWESMIHMFGYLLILLLIITITYNDILRIVMG